MPTASLLRQHLIDPEVCIRCNTCEEACPRDAITHDGRNYVVKPDRCNACGDCLPPCPTGAIDSWRDVRAPWDLAAQFAWDELPPQADLTAARDEVPDEITAITAVATASVGRVPPPWSAAHPYVGLHPPERPARAVVAANHRITDPGSEADIHHLILDLGRTAFPVLEGQSVGVIPPGVDAQGRPHHVRLYSIASPRDGERPRHNNLALTVKRVTHTPEGAPVRGVASNYLCDLPRGAEVLLTGPWGASFLMPNHPGAKLLLVCTGTGAAPMRAMTERRRRRLALGEGGEELLFFGARSPAELPYFGPLMKLPRALLDVELAFSRSAAHPRAWVQDRIRARRADVARLLTDDDGFVYLCGHKRMEAGVMEAFSEAAASVGADWAALRERLRAEGRLHVETY